MKNNLAVKITIGYTVIIVIALLTLGLLYINFFRAYTFDIKESNMLNRTREVANISSSYLTQSSNLSDFIPYINLLDSLANSRVWIIDVQGNILEKSEGEIYGIEETNPLANAYSKEDVFNRILNGQEVIIEDETMFFTKPMISVGVPIYGTSGNIIGGVLLHSPSTEVTDTVDSSFLILLICTLFAVLISILAGRYYSSFITKPIKNINYAAMEMTRGNYEINTNIRQNDEIGQLSKSLDMLSAKLNFSTNKIFEEKEKLNDIISSIPEGIVAYDINLSLINYNKSLLSLYGYSNETDIEKHLKLDLETQGLLAILLTTMTTNKKQTSIKDWRYQILKYTFTPVRNNCSTTTGVVILIQDISESEKLEKMRKDFIANVSHELRTPLTLIQGSVEALIDKTVTSAEETQKYHKRILQETLGLERIVSDLLDLSRIDVGKMSFTLVPIDFKNLTIDVVNSFKKIAHNKDIIIEFHTPEKIPKIEADYGRIQQVLIIFIDNAIKYSKPSTKIELTIEVGDYVYLKIADSGIGISEEDLPFVWERFFKVDKSRSDPNNGIGLGLSIAKKIIEGHNGVAMIESEPNNGTTVIFGLPYIKN